MSSASRKKIDEKNVKILRDLVSLPHNKYCFDCNQRGPTYVNVTIGSFVCTKCSGLLRGITPPHRVKSISMATFTQEEIELLKRRGNEYCKRVWCGLYEGKGPSEVRDEEFVRNFMMDKYERRRYYLEPSPSPINGVHPQTSTYSTNKTVEIKPLANTKIPRTNGAVIERNHRNAINKVPDFVADFGTADIYDAIYENKDNKFNNNSTQFSFANFDNNTIFNSNIDSTASRVDDWDFSNFNTSFHQQQATLFPKCNVNNHWNPFIPLTDSRSYKTTKIERNWVLFNNEETTHLTNVVPPSSNGVLPAFHSTGTPAPSEDRYAALKDLDNAMKEQPQIDWNSSSNGSSYGSVTPTSSVYSTPSPHGSMYGSPSQGQFTSMFPQQDSKISNPFSNGGGMNWNDAGNHTNGAPNPFRTTNNKINGALTGSNTAFHTSNGTAWIPNPFTVGASASNGHSNNPFL